MSLGLDDINFLNVIFMKVGQCMAIAQGVFIFLSDKDGRHFKHVPI